MTDDRDELALANDRLAVHLASRHHRAVPPGVPLDDLVQEARVGLLKAARTWRPEVVPAFGPYAALVVNRHLQLAVRRERRCGFSGTRDSVVGSPGWLNPPRREPDEKPLWDLGARAEPPRFPAGWVEAVAAALPRPSQRRAVLLLYRDLLTQTEAGRLLGVTRSAVEVAHREAVAWLRANCPPELLDVGA